MIQCSTYIPKTVMAPLDSAMVRLFVHAPSPLLLLHSATVCGGLPVLNVVTRDLFGARILGIEGIFNSTTSYILGQMLAGVSGDEVRVCLCVNWRVTILTCLRGPAARIAVFVGHAAQSRLQYSGGPATEAEFAPLDASSHRPVDPSSS